MKSLKLFRFAAPTAMALVLALGVGCQKEEDAPKSIEPVTITASIEPASTDTKTYLNPSDWTAYWTAGDIISVSALPVSGEDVVNKLFLLNTGAGEKRATFTDEELPEWPLGEATYFAVYPYQPATITGNPKVINLFYNAFQNVIQGEGGQFTPGVMISRTTSTGVPATISFTNIFSIIKISITGEGTLNTVTFRDLSGQPVAGPYTVAVADGTAPDDSGNYSYYFLFTWQESSQFRDRRTFGNSVRCLLEP